MINLAIDDENEPTQEERDTYGELAENIFLAYIAYHQGTQLRTAEKNYRHMGKSISNGWIGLARIVSDVAQAMCKEMMTDSDTGKSTIQ